MPRVYLSINLTQGYGNVGQKWAKQGRDNECDKNARNRARATSIFEHHLAGGYEKAGQK